MNAFSKSRVALLWFLFFPVTPSVMAQQATRLEPENNSPSACTVAPCESEIQTQCCAKKSSLPSIGLPMPLEARSRIVTFGPGVEREGSSNKATGIGLAIGAGTGFGLGLWAGLAWFDDATNSDQKVWGTAVAFTVAGGLIGALVGASLGGDDES